MVVKKSIEDILWDFWAEVLNRENSEASAPSPERDTPYIRETAKRLRSIGRELGIKQAASFIGGRVTDQPTLAGEIIKYVIPHGWQATNEIVKLVRGK